MPKIKSKVVRVRNPVTGEWNDMPAVVSVESLRAADRAKVSEDAAAESALVSEAWSDGQRDGADVTSGDPAYQNNAKYWKDRAKDEKEGAEAWSRGTKNGADVGSSDPAYHDNAKYWKGLAEDEKEDAEAWAKGTKNGEAVSSGADQYHDNAKYWNDEAKGEKEDAEAYAVGKRGGVDVTSGDEAYQNNAKYWNDEAKDEKEDAEAYAVGKRAGVDVTSGDEAYRNNAKYYADLASENGEAWAEGTRNGTPVGSSAPEYHHNAKYHADAASGSATSAAASAASAAEAALTGNLAPVYSSSATYAAGDYVLYNGTLYVCKTAITTAEAWTAAHWTAVKIAPEVADVKNALTDIENRFDNPNVMDYDSLTFDDRFTNFSGQILPASTTNSVIFPVEPETDYYLQIVGGYNRNVMVGNSTDEFVTFTTYDLITTQTPETNAITFTTPQNVHYVMLYFYSGEYVFSKDNFKLYEGNTLPTETEPFLKKENLPGDILYEDSNIISEMESDIDNLENQNSVKYETGNYINLSGNAISNNNYAITDFVRCDDETRIVLKDVWTGTSSLAYAFYNESKTFISGQNSVVGTLSISTIPSNAKYVRFCSRISNNENPQAIVYDTRTIRNEIASLITDVSDIETDISQMQDDISELQGRELVEPKDTTFFAGINYFDPNKTTLYTDRFVDTDGKIKSGSNTISISFPVEPSTTYIIYIPPESNRGIVGESETNEFSVGTQTTKIYSGGHNADNKITFTTGATAKYVFMYFNSGSYDYAIKKSDFVLNKDVYTGNITPYIGNEYLPSFAQNPLSGKQILVFGDSITDTCNFTINASDQTTAMTWRNPSNSYTPPGGSTIYFSMWPKILRDSQGFEEIRNYARSGASYKTSSRTSGEERQNLQYQITVALNDKDNPNNVFEVDHFYPDIVIFALGTNDGTPNDTFESAMNKTVLEEDGYTIDVEATLENLDDTKFCESARKAFLRIKQVFPLAQIYCVLPIQRANNNINWGTLRTYLSAMAERYGCIIVDGTAESGIPREFNVWNAVGEYLKDGLHPNDKGQNLMARMILASLRSHYIPFGVGFNLIS